MQEPKQKRAIYLSTSASGEREIRAPAGTELPLRPELGAGPVWALTSHLQPMGKATETSSDRGQFGERQNTFPPPVCLLPGCSLAWMKNKPMSGHPQSSSSAPSCRWAGISVGQDSQAGELPPQPSANTNPWGPAWLWGNTPAAPNLPITKAQHPLAASPSSPKPWLPSFTMELMGSPWSTCLRKGLNRGHKSPKSRPEPFKRLRGHQAQAGTGLELVTAVAPAQE